MFDFIAVLVALTLAALVVVGMALGVHWGRQRPYGLLPYVIYPVLLVYALYTLLSGRDLSGGEALAVLQVSKHPLVTWLGRLTSLFILFACAERVLYRSLRWGRQAPLVPALVLAFAVFFLTNTVSPALLGRYVYLSHEFLYVIALGCAAVLVTEEAELQLALRAARNACLGFAALSLACLALKPGLVMASYHAGYIPGFHWRFVGLANHSNNMGSLLVFFMVCLWCQPFARRALNRAAWALAWTGLLLTQSKTSWSAALLSAAALAYFGHRAVLLQRWRDFRQPYLPLALLFGLMGGATVLCLAFMFGDPGARLARFLGSQQGAELLSLTGRDQIWQIAVQEWQKNPLFGYGLSIWDDAFRKSIAMPHAMHAHNQFYQSLSSAGLVGVAGLLCYLAVLLWFIARTVQRSHGLALALFILLAIKAVSEVPLAMKGMGPDLLTQVLLLMTLSVYSRRPAALAAPAP
ncbi:O-antigen ligase, partial [Massilia sp. YIM B04103]|uniref:O-antigen ligase family protein n=1 Tax=Massilia sp. YIM B04103 TaxID=2963106 RepID=UPI00210E6B66